MLASPHTIRTQMRATLVGLLLVTGLPSAVIAQDASRAATTSRLTVVLAPASPVFDKSRVPQGVVNFTATIENEGAAAITLAHPSICVPDGYEPGSTRSPNDSHGRSEILFTIAKPDGTTVVLRDSYAHYFDPDNRPLISVPPDGVSTIQIGWFFQNARGRWERDDEAANVFLDVGQYKVRLLFRNTFRKALISDRGAGGLRYVDVWTGQMESPEITVDVR